MDEGVLTYLREQGISGEVLPSQGPNFKLIRIIDISHIAVYDKVTDDIVTRIGD